MTCVLSGCKCGGTFDERHTDRIRAVTVAPSSAVPLETMIEDMGGVSVFENSLGNWTACPESWGNADDAITGPTVYEAVSALYATWRERE